ncbi:hypothetical protein SSS_06852, partial [Sarcoptes scabiei]
YRETYPELFNQNLSSFDIIDRIDELSHIRNPFDINPMDGSLYLKYYVDYEIITGYSLLISVKDQAWYPMESVYPYEIRVSDDDDFIGYNMIDSDKLYHSSPKTDPMSIGVMVILFFFIILILVISTSFFIYHKQKKRLLNARKLHIDSLRGPYEIKYPNAIVSDQHHSIDRQENSSNLTQSNEIVSNHQFSSIRFNANHQHHQQFYNHSAQPLMNTLSSQSIAPSVASNLNIRMGSMRNSQLSTPQSSSLTPTRITGRPDIVVPDGQNHQISKIEESSVINQHSASHGASTVVSSNYTQSNSENYTENYSNILATAEHYDLENASSIAPSDIDIVYHYKGFRNRESLNQNHRLQDRKHAPLSRISPSFSEVSLSHPHILTLQDLSNSPPIPPPPHPSMLNGRLTKQIDNLNDPRIS